MNKSDPQGCLGFLLGLFQRLINLFGGGDSSKEAELPFRRRDDFLSEAELSFYRVLTSAVGERATVCPKVNLADIVFVVGMKANFAWKNKIDRKHVDFLVCDPVTMQPSCAVELDDSSHDRRDRQDRDELVNAVFRAAKIPLVRVRAAAKYRGEEILSTLEPHLGGFQLRQLPPAVNEAPLCPKCGVLMVERTAQQGLNAGKAFFGCQNYPRCKQIVNRK